MSTSGTFCVFAKRPVPGRVKTRLAQTVGQVCAAEMATALLRDTVEGLEALGVRVVLATTDGEMRFPWTSRPCWDQGVGDLGARIERILTRALDLGPWAVAMGADSPGISAVALQRAVALLDAGRDVWMPAEDGGFVLMGLHRCPPGLLADLPWSQSDTGERTLARLRAVLGAQVALEAGFDVDTEADLHHFMREVPERAAPHTWAAIRHWGLRLPS